MELTSAQNLKRPERPSLVTLAYEAIVEAIVDRRMAPGSRISIDALAEQLEMSTTPVREALMRTVTERLVIQDHNRGFTVAPLLTAAEYHDLFEVRHLLEMHAIRHCNLNDQTLASLAALLDQMASMEHGTVYRDFRNFSKADATLHRSLVAMSNNRFLLQSYRDLHFHLHVGRLYAGAGVIDFGEALQEHSEIMAALQAHDLARAEAVVDHHVRCAEARLRTLVRGVSLTTD